MFEAFVADDEEDVDDEDDEEDDDDDEEDDSEEPPQFKRCFLFVCSLAVDDCFLAQTDTLFCMLLVLLQARPFIFWPNSMADSIVGDDADAAECDDVDLLDEGVFE